MDLSAALVDLSTLIRGWGDDDDPTPSVLAGLTDTLERTVPSFLGLQIVLVQHAQPVTLTAFGPTAQPDDVHASLRLPLSRLGVPDVNRAGALTLYAGTPGAFVDLAADLSYALEQPRRTNGEPGTSSNLAAIRLDAPIRPTTTTSGLGGLAEWSTISRAIGMLIGEGHLLDDAHTELARRAAVAGISIVECATQLTRPSSRYPCSV